MKRMLFLFAIAFVAISAMASLKDMSWTIYGMECGSTFCYDVKVQKDTIVNGQIYYYIPATHSLSADKMAFGAFLREDGQKVYLLNDKTGEDMLLYDYSLQKGDSIRIIFASNISDKKWSYTPLEDFDMPASRSYFYVIYVDMVTLENGEQRKRLRLDAGFAVFDIIEGIGSTRGILAAVNYWPQTTCDHNSKLLCCSENKCLLYKEDPASYENMPDADKIICGCETINAVENVSETDIPQDAICTVYSPTGIIILSGVKMRDINNLLTNGIYIISATDGKNDYITKVGIFD